MDAASQHAAFRNSITLIEYHVDKEEKTECDKMEMIMHRLGADRSQGGTWRFSSDKTSFCSYKIDKPPYFVLNRLETEGYKVVGTNTVSYYLIWTLHRQPEPQA